MINKLIIPFLICLISNSLDAKEIDIKLVQSCKKHSLNDLYINKNMLSDRNKKIALSYLKKYEEKDLKGIEEVFSDDIILRDWKIRVEGKEKALIETQKNFASVESIKIDVLSIYENENTVAAELKIIINNTDELYVIDVITINSIGKINSIKAFLGRGDK